MWGLRNFDHSQTCCLSGEKGSAGVGRWKTCLWESKYSAFFSSESFLLWISSFVAVQGFENDEKASIWSSFPEWCFVTRRKIVDGFCSGFPCPTVMALPVRRVSRGQGPSKDKFLSRELSGLLFSSSWCWRSSALLRLYFQWLSNFNKASNSSVAFSKGECSVLWIWAMNFFSEPLQVFALLPGSCLYITVPSPCCLPRSWIKSRKVPLVMDYLALTICQNTGWLPGLN